MGLEIHGFTDNPKQIGKQEPYDRVSRWIDTNEPGNIVCFWGEEGTPETGGQSGMKASLLHYFIFTWSWWDTAGTLG